MVLFKLTASFSSAFFPFAQNDGAGMGNIRCFWHRGFHSLEILTCMSSYNVKMTGATMKNEESSFSRENEISFPYKQTFAGSLVNRFSNIRINLISGVFKERFHHSKTITASQRFWDFIFTAFCLTCLINKHKFLPVSISGLHKSNWMGFS